MKKIFLISTVFLAIFRFSLPAQDLDKLLGNIDVDNTPDYAYGTFKGTTIINGQSVEVPGRKDLHFLISHRFGAVNTGIYNFFGLDQATTRLGLEYGIADILSVSIGRSTYEKTYDAGIKVKVLRQQTGIKNIPLTMSVFCAGFVETTKWEDPERDNLFSSRLSFSTQLLIARKFNKHLSLQISPSYVHINLVPTAADQNNIYSVGFGGRYKLTPKFSINSEYYYLLPGETADDYANSLSFGVDIETGGHVFQLHFTNSQLMYTPGFIARTEGKWEEGDIFIGFNIFRVFSLSRKDKSKH
jgi:hypothetical protein